MITWDAMANKPQWVALALADDKPISIAAAAEILYGDPEVRNWST